MRFSDWLTRMRADPKGQMEGDLAIAVAGLIIIALGGIVAVAGLHPRTQIHDNAPNPTAGNIIAAMGAFVVLLGLILVAVNAVIWLTGPRRRGRPLSEDEALLQSIRDDGRRAGPSEPLRPPPAPDVPPGRKPG